MPQTLWMSFKSARNKLNAWNLTQTLWMSFKSATNIILMHEVCHKNYEWALNKENIIYIRGEFRVSLGMNFFSPFQSEREFKVSKSCKCSQMLCSRVH